MRAEEGGVNDEPDSNLHSIMSDAVVASNDTPAQSPPPVADDVALEDLSIPVAGSSALHNNSANNGIDMDLDLDSSECMHTPNDITSVTDSFDATNSHEEPGEPAKVPLFPPSPSAPTHNAGIAKNGDITMAPLEPKDTLVPLAPNAAPHLTQVPPDWFMLAYDAFAAGGLGSTYGDLLVTYAILETGLGFERVCIGLQLKGQPKLLSKWVGHGHMKRAMPVLAMEDVPKFCNMWWAWWRSLQPGWRKPGLVGRLEQDAYSDKWTSLNVSGPNGWLGIMATLFWWGKAIEGLEMSARDEWMEAVTDSLWVLKGLLVFVQN